MHTFQQRTNNTVNSPDRMQDVSAVHNGNVNEQDQWSANYSNRYLDIYP